MKVLTRLGKGTRVPNNEKACGVAARLAAVQVVVTDRLETAGLGLSVVRDPPPRRPSLEDEALADRDAAEAALGEIADLCGVSRYEGPPDSPARIVEAVRALVATKGSKP